jgi:Plasmid pRiA4b ORF-3-like protein
MKKYQFTLQSRPELCPLPCEEFTAKLELSGNPTLYNLAFCLNEAIKFQFDHPFGFYSNLESPYDENDEKYTLFSDMGESEDGALGVQKTLVADVFTKGKKMLFLFDYGDDWHFHVTCDEISNLKSKREGWKLLSFEGKHPVQYPDCDE